MSRKIDPGLVNMIWIVAREFDNDDPERAQRLAEQAIEIARNSPQPEWLPIREGKNFEWRWKIAEGKVARVWPLESGSWVAEIESSKEQDRYVRIFKTSQNGMNSLQGVISWQFANAQDAGSS